MPKVARIYHITAFGMNTKIAVANFHLQDLDNLSVLDRPPIWRPCRTSASSQQMRCPESQPLRPLSEDTPEGRCSIIRTNTTEWTMPSMSQTNPTISQFVESPQQHHTPSFSLSRKHRATPPWSDISKPCHKQSRHSCRSPTAPARGHDKRTCQARGLSQTASVETACL